MRTVLLSILLAFASLSSFGDSLIRLHSPGLGKKATNAVLNAAIAYTDAEIANTGNAYTNLVISQVGLVWDYFRDPSNIVLRAAIDHADGATNAAISAAYAYTDLAISKACLLTEAHIAPDGSTNIYPSTEAYVIPSNTIGFFLDNHQSLQGTATFEVVAPVETPVYVAKGGEILPDNAWELLFTCGTIGQPIEFYLVATVQPTNVDDKSARQVIFKLRRTF